MLSLKAVTGTMMNGYYLKPPYGLNRPLLGLMMIRLPTSPAPRRLLILPTLAHDYPAVS